MLSSQVKFSADKEQTDIEKAICPKSIDAGA